MYMLFLDHSDSLAPDGKTAIIFINNWYIFALTNDYIYELTITSKNKWVISNK